MAQCKMQCIALIFCLKLKEKGGKQENLELARFLLYIKVSNKKEKRRDVLYGLHKSVS